MEIFTDDHINGICIDPLRKQLLHKRYPQFCYRHPSQLKINWRHSHPLGTKLAVMQFGLTAKCVQRARCLL